MKGIIFFLAVAWASKTTMAAGEEAKVPPVANLESTTETVAKTTETWFDQHSGEPNFGTVTQFALALAEIQYHTAKESENSFVWGGGETFLGLKLLYEESPQKAVWVSKFWRRKAMIANQAFLDGLVASYSKKGDFNKNEKAFKAEIEESLQVFYYDHWKAIEEMIVFNLQMARTEKEKESK